jgi:hypothetical protein
MCEGRYQLARSKAGRHGQATTVGGDFPVVRILRRVFYPAKVESEAGRVHVSRAMMGPNGLTRLSTLVRPIR